MFDLTVDIITTLPSKRMCIGFYRTEEGHYVRCKKLLLDHQIYCQRHSKRQENPAKVVRDLAFLSACLEESIREARHRIRVEKRTSRDRRHLNPY